METAAIVPVAGALFGGGSLYLNAAKHFKPISEHGDLRAALGAIRKMPLESQFDWNKADAASEKHWDHLIRMLDYGTILMGALQRRLINRAVVALVILVLGIATTTIDGGVTPSIVPAVGLSGLDLLIIIVLVIVPRIAFADNIVSPDEQQFLRGVGALQDALYTHYVRPALAAFNSEVTVCFSDETATYDKDLAALQTKVNDIDIALQRLKAKGESA